MMNWQPGAPPVEKARFQLSHKQDCQAHVPEGKNAKGLQLTTADRAHLGEKLPGALLLRKGLGGLRKDLSNLLIYAPKILQ